MLVGLAYSQSNDYKKERKGRRRWEKKFENELKEKIIKHAYVKTEFKKKKRVGRI